MISEEQLIIKLKSGSKPAFDALYKMYANRLYGYCLQYSKSAEDSKEIVQNVFIKLWINREKIMQDKSICSLLFTIAKHDLINAYKKRLNSPVYEDYVLYGDSVETSDDTSCIDYHIFVEQIKKSLKKLPATQQKIIHLSRFENMTNAEIAQRLNLSEQTVKNQLSLGLKELKTLLKFLLIVLWLLLVNK